MLEQILRDMYIAPELLEELPEEQKQLLFVRMREEQIRRYKEKEKELAVHEVNKKLNKPCRKKVKNVDFMLGDDGKEWVWLMGEHTADKRIEDIIEEEQMKRAQELAEKEAEDMKRREEEEAKRRIEMEQQQLELTRRDDTNKDPKQLSPEPPNPTVISPIPSPNQAKNLVQSNTPPVEAKPEIRLRSAKDRTHDVIKRRSCEIFVTFRELREQFESAALAEKGAIEANWRAAEEKARQAEKELREMARLARHEAEEKKVALAAAGTVDMSPASSATSVSNWSSPDCDSESVYYSFPQISPKVSTTDKTDRFGTSPPPPLPPKPVRMVPDMSCKPACKKDVVTWFRNDEFARGAVVDAKSGTIPGWFHGLISREEAERLLTNKPLGAFLVRVSEKIYGYAVSYVAKFGIKHFLIETTVCGDNGGVINYRFFGKVQSSYLSLLDMIKFFESHPVSEVSGDLLLTPCGQEQYPPDYYDLIYEVNAASEDTRL